METFKPSAVEKQEAMTEAQETPVAPKWEVVDASKDKTEEAFRAEVVSKLEGYGVSHEIAQRLVSELNYDNGQTFGFYCYDDSEGAFDPDGEGKRTIYVESSASWIQGMNNGGVIYWPDSGKVRVLMYHTRTDVMKEYTV